MAVYQPRRATIATILVTVIIVSRGDSSTNYAVMQDDICEELVGRHKRGIKLPLHFSLPGFLDFFRFRHFLAFSVTVVRIFVLIIAL